MKIAFASTGTFVDQHFGNAVYFQIYNVNGKEYSFSETRKTSPKCDGNCGGGFKHLLELLNDCEAIFVLKIGRGAAEFMLANGKRVFEATGELEEIIAELIENDALEQRNN